MQGVNQSVLISAAFVEIADCLVGKYDALDVLRTLVDHCVAVLDVTAAGIVLADEAGNLQVLASTSEASQHVELLQHKAGTGPCIDSYRYGKVITLSDIKAQGDRYPAFQAAALSQGFQSVHAIPMRIRPQTIGALNLFRHEKGTLSVEDARIGQALADLGTICILHERATEDSALVTSQLMKALDSRTVIEQAKGIIAQLHNIDMHEAFTLLRNHARAHQTSLHVTADGVIANRVLI